jgi:hypothetical protein
MALRLSAVRAGLDSPLGGFLSLPSVRVWDNRRAQWDWKIEISCQFIGNRTRVLPACGIAPQPATLPAASHTNFYYAAREFGSPVFIRDTFGRRGTAGTAFQLEHKRTRRQMISAPYPLLWCKTLPLFNRFVRYSFFINADKKASVNYLFSHFLHNISAMIMATTQFYVLLTLIMHFRWGYCSQCSIAWMENTNTVCRNLTVRQRRLYQNVIISTFTLYHNCWTLSHLHAVCISGTSGCHVWLLKCHSISHWDTCCLGLEVVTAVTMNNVVFWDIKTLFAPHRRHITSPLQRPAG